ncbi:MAG TPA: YceI family protein [Steroidobacteraceae bacterium]|nr:YceI family protein [Steroidobacteraceae bacterium]
MRRLTPPRASLSLRASAGLLAPLCLACAAGAAGAAPAYIPDAQQSRLEFTGTQAGAKFKGVFHKFTAAVEFAPDALASSRIDAQVDLNSVDTMDKDRDGVIRGADIFDVSRWPTAHYVTRSFAKTATGFAAQGALTLRGVTRDVPIDFVFTQTAAGAKLDGSARLKRLDFGAGQGDWKTGEWVGDAVTISFSLVLKPKS